MKTPNGVPSRLRPRPNRGPVRHAAQPTTQGEVGIFRGKILRTGGHSRWSWGLRRRGRTGEPRRELRDDCQRRGSINAYEAANRNDRNSLSGQGLMRKDQVFSLQSRMASNAMAEGSEQPSQSLDDGMRGSQRDPAVSTIIVHSESFATTAPIIAVFALPAPRESGAETRDPPPPRAGRGASRERAR